MYYFIPLTVLIVTILSYVFLMCLEKKIIKLLSDASLRNLPITGAEIAKQMIKDEYKKI